MDSSKLPPYGVLLAGLPGIELRVLHVVRDPRAAAFSWRRRRALDTGDDRLMTRHPVWKAALLWSVWNAATIRLWGRGDYLRVRYEDLVGDPAAVIAADRRLRRGRTGRRAAVHRGRAADAEPRPTRWPGTRRGTGPAGSR